MLIKKSLVALGMFLFLSQPVTAEMDKEFAPVEKIFDALSAFDHEGMKSAVTPSFVLLEHGEVWDIQKLIDAVKPAEYQRRNFISVISKDVKAEMAVINYWNKAVFKSGDKTTERAWLESAVVVKTENGWLLEQMHSTRIKLEDLPKGLEFIEL
ncbi:nuclear transport factor 2 family protein [Microbulbifer agarilyticus]|uniref:nuclear transport factor 2 family protein n=1 Tax=Microbulbifer agarilyticus TaxID=260552 RepID=UPI001CD80AC5|nr:nuclear transport factor 2 family protein [Microbulbifer agarilyticus]MCA0894021.1 nuclear transport factor 2 family protein [Microbulbifer agarilyticus]